MSMGLYASPPPVAMAVVGWFLCFPAFFFFWKKGFFFSHTRLTPQKKKFTPLTPKEKNSVEKKNAIYAQKKVYATYNKKKQIRRKKT